ncbi:MAG TPA: ABC transporter ATP-binding protein [Thermoplasmata archaeon]
MTNPSIVVSSLTKRFGSFVAVSNLDLKIEGSKCVGFLGPNGAGKTTTLKVLADMIFPDVGECFLNGVSVRRDRKKALGSCGVLIESPEIYPSLTPNEALGMVADLRGLSATDRKERTEEVLAEVKMSEWGDKKFGKFSKGMKQRINIAAALLHDPEILMLDEPATGLDPRGMTEVRDIVRGLKRRHRLVFMSSHILSEVTDVCDEVALIDRGRLLFYDTLENVTARFSRGQSSIDVNFRRPLSHIELTRSIPGLPGVEKVEVLDPRRIRVRFSGGLETQESLLESLVGLHLGLVSFQESTSALEDIYLSQIQKGD